MNMTLNNDNSNNTEYTLSGHLIKQTFYFEIPDIYSEQCEDGEPGDEFRWINRLGEFIIDEVSFFIGEEKNRYFYWRMDIYLESTLFEKSKEDGYNRMIGNLDEVHQNSSTTDPYFYPNSSAFNNEPIIPAIKGRKIIVPSPFWYTYLPGCEFPICSLDKINQPEIKITLKPISHIYTINDMNDGNLKKRLIMIITYSIIQI